MNPIKYFIDFYTNLSVPGLVLFWLIIVFFLFLFFTVIALLVKNSHLKEKIITYDEKIKEKEELIRRLRINHDMNKHEPTPPIKPIPEQTKIVVEKKEKVINNNERKIADHLYKENVLKKVATRTQTSPVAIRPEELKFKAGVDSVSMGRLSETKVTNEKLEPVDLSIKDYEEEYYDSLNDGHTSFVEEISKQEPTKPNIDLTDYEQAQEEDAIISYQELLKSNPRLRSQENHYQEIDDEDFLEELKTFRDNL